MGIFHKYFAKRYSSLHVVQIPRKFSFRYHFLFRRSERRPAWRWATHVGCTSHSPGTRRYRTCIQAPWCVWSCSEDEGIWRRKDGDLHKSWISMDECEIWILGGIFSILMRVQKWVWYQINRSKENREPYLHHKVTRNQCFHLSDRKHLLPSQISSILINVPRQHQKNLSSFPRPRFRHPLQSRLQIADKLPPRIIMHLKCLSTPPAVTSHPFVVTTTKKLLSTRWKMLSVCF